MKISILNFDLSNNSLGRAYILAKILSRRYEVEIIGPQFGNSMWSPVANDKTIKYTVLFKSLKDLKNNLKQIDGDIIYAIKPYGTSYGYALLKKLLNKKPVILDEDDWDFGFYIDKPIIQIVKEFLHVDIFNINNPLYIYILGKLAFIADSVTVSSTFLQKKFGGTIIPHARDEEMFNIDQKKVDELKKEYNPEGNKIIMFYGSVRKHKGIDIIIDALDTLNYKNVTFMIVGVDKDSQQFIPNRTYIKTLPPQNFDILPNILSLADLVVLPQKKSTASLGQVPAKIFDAMALGKPIIASNISDIPLILKGCGLIFEPEDIVELSNNIKYIIDNPIEALNFGKKAKEKFLLHYSFNAVENTLFKVIKKVIKQYSL